MLPHDLYDGLRLRMRDEDIGPAGKDRQVLYARPAGGMEEGKDGQDALLPILQIGKPAPELLGVAGDVRVGQHDPFAWPRRPLRVQERPHLLPAGAVFHLRVGIFSEQREKIVYPRLRLDLPVESRLEVRKEFVPRKGKVVGDVAGNDRSYARFFLESKSHEGSRRSRVISTAESESLS